MTKLRGSVLAVTAVLLLAGCGAGATDTPPAANGGHEASSLPPGDGGNQPPQGGSLDCTAINRASGELVVGVQLLAQIRDPESVERLKGGTAGPRLDLDQLAADLATLDPLAAYPSPLGDPGQAIAAYKSAVAEAKELFAADPATQDAIDAYHSHLGSISDFLGHQVPIGGAVDKAGC